MFFPPIHRWHQILNDNIFVYTQGDVKGSIAEFMSFVHVSVNESSKQYLANERRYNYTTPKSFLEQIKLYESLLAMKSKELTAKMERLENGLTKLQSTAQQVFWINW